MATVEVDTLLVKLEARVTDFEKKLAQAQRTAQSSSNKIAGTFNSLNSKINGAFRTLGVGLGLVAIERFIQKTVEAGSEISDLSQRLGISAEDFQKFSFAASQTAANQDAFVAGFRGMVNFLKQASTGSKDAVAVLKSLGLSFDDLKKKSPTAVFEILLDRIGKIQNPLQRAAVLQTVLSKSGAQLGALSLLGAAGIEELKKQAVDVGAVMSNQTVEALDKAGDKFDSLGRTVTVASAALLDPLLPAIESVAAAVQNPEFQAGLKSFADRLAQIIGLLTAHPELLGILGGAAVGGRVAGPVGALAGAVLGGAASGVPVVVGNQSQLRAPAVGAGLGAAAGAAIGGTSIGAVAGAAIAGLPASPTEAAAPITAIAKASTLAVPPVKALAASTSSVADSVTALLAGFPDLVDDFDNLGTTSEDAADKAQKVADGLKFDAEQMVRTAREQAAYNAVQQAGVDITTKLGQAIADQARANFDLQKSIADSINKLDDMRATATDVFSGIIDDIKAGKSAAEILGDVFAQLAQKLASIGIEKLVAGLFGAAGGPLGGLLGGLFGGFRADGGAVSPGRGYVLGERGPEFFVPNVSGTIVPATAAGGMLVQHRVELVLSPEVDARILRVAGPQSQQISFAVVRANNKQARRSQELAG